MPKKQKILVIHLEFPRWKTAKSWGYQAQLGFNVGLESNGANIQSFIKLYANKNSNNWMKAVKERVGAQKFDMVWMEVVHSEYSNDFLDFVSELAPVRLAMLGESLCYDENECFYAPVLRTRCDVVKRQLAYFTHALCVDEADVDLIENECGKRALWWVVGVPEWSIVRSIQEPIYDKASFSGPLYGARIRFVEHPDLSRCMLHLTPMENSGIHPKLFNATQMLYETALRALPVLAGYYNNAYVGALQNMRVRLFRSWIEGLKRGIAVVQLPHFVKAFPGRIYEGMAAGRPVITMRLKNRPKAMQLFEPNKEILFYDDSPEEIVELISMLQKDKRIARKISENAAIKLRSHHTMDNAVKQILRWVEKGDIPVYW